MIECSLSGKFGLNMTRPPIDQPSSATARPREFPRAGESHGETVASPVAALDGRLLAELAPSVLRVVRQMLGPRDPDVEDLAQDSLRALVVAWPNFRGECSARHFAKRIAAQRCIDAIRGNRVRSRVLFQLAQDTSSEAEGAPSSARLRQSWRLALAELPVEQATALTQRYVLGYTLEEIAGEAAVPLNTVKSRLRLAKQVLRTKVAQDPRLAELLEAP